LGTPSRSSPLINSFILLRVISHCCGLPSVPSNGQTSEPGHWRAKVDDHARQVRSTFNRSSRPSHSHTAAVPRVCACVRWQSRPSWVHSAPLLRLPPFHVRRPWVEFFAVRAVQFSQRWVSPPSHTCNR
jgi:hypothetical protein